MKKETIKDVCKYCGRQKETVEKRVQTLFCDYCGEEIDNNTIPGQMKINEEMYDFHYQCIEKMVKSQLKLK